jgi:magnesium and cobalt transporter
LEEDADSSLVARLARLFGGREQAAEDLEEKVAHLLEAGERQGLISREEGEMVRSIFEFRDTMAREIMIPRTEVVAAPVIATAPEIIGLIIESGHSRIPVYEANLDSIIGAVHAKDLLQYWGASNGELELRKILRPVYFVPETKQISRLLKELRQRKSHLAVVIDEYGGTSGLVTVEDIIEEIVGEIEDEYDLAEQRLMVLDDHTVVADARLEIESLEEHFGVEFPEGEFESVGGFVVHLAGRVPKPSETFRYDGLEFTVESADERKIRRLKVNAIEPGAEAAGGEETAGRPPEAT